MHYCLNLIIALVFSQTLLAAEAEAPLPREIIVNGVEFVLVPEGWFHYTVRGMEMHKDQPRQSKRRTIKAWTDSVYIGKYEARARDFTRFMNAGQAEHLQNYFPPKGDDTSSYGAFKGCSVQVNEKGEFYELFPGGNYPATNLSWDLANEFASWMGFRLPTDAEWVHAFRGDDERIYPWGDDYPDDTFASFEEGATACNTQPVDSRPKGRSPYGVYNMAGNAFEYVADWSNMLYEGSLRDGVRNPLAAEVWVAPHHHGEKRRQLRGGRWASGPHAISLGGNRDTQRHDEPFICFGTRFALSADVARKHLLDGTATVVTP